MPVSAGTKHKEEISNNCVALALAALTPDYVSRHLDQLYTHLRPNAPMKTLINASTKAPATYWRTLQYTRRTYLSHHCTYTLCPQTYLPHISAPNTAPRNPHITLIHRTYAPTIDHPHPSHISVRPLHIQIAATHSPVYLPTHPWHPHQHTHRT